MSLSARSPRDPLYRHAYSHCPMTLPLHLAILTGLLPHLRPIRPQVLASASDSHSQALPSAARKLTPATAQPSTGAMSSHSQTYVTLSLRPLSAYP